MKSTVFAVRLREWARRDRHPPAIVTAEGSIGYAELCARAERCAHWLVAEGCRPTEAVGVTIGDETTHVVVSVALLFLGVPQVALQTTESPEVRAARAARLRVRHLIATDPGHALPGIRLSRPAAEVLAAAPGGGTCEALNDDPDAPAVIVTSSGTTGEAKLLALSQRMLAIRAGVRLYRPGTRMLMLGSVEDYPAKAGRLMGLYEGITAVLRPDAIGSFADVPAWCERLGVDRLDIGLLQAIDLAPEPTGARRLPSGITVFVGGTRVPASLRLAYGAAGTRLLVEYGAREVSGVTCTYPVDADPLRESVGSVLADVELEILDEKGERVAPGTIGEIRVRRPGMVIGYVDDPVATAARFRDGWFHTGDLASLAEDGTLCIHGRRDDRMNLSGIKVYPAEIERVLEALPGVAAAAAFAVRSELHGEIPVAAVEAREGAAIDASAVVAQARAALGLRAPRRVIVVERLPRNAAGKVLIRELEPLFAPRR